MVQLIKTEEEIYDRIDYLKEQKERLIAEESYYRTKNANIVEICHIDGEIKGLYWVLAPENNILTSLEFKKKKGMK